MKEGEESLTFPGPGGYKIEWNPGFTRIALNRAPSGHLVIPCDGFQGIAQKPQAGTPKPLYGFLSFIKVLGVPIYFVGRLKGFLSFFKPGWWIRIFFPRHFSGFLSFFRSVPGPSLGAHVLFEGVVRETYPLCKASLGLFLRVPLSFFKGPFKGILILYLSFFFRRSLSSVKGFLRGSYPFCLRLL